MAEDHQSTNKVGRIISGIGVAWALLFFVGNFLEVGGTPLGDLLGFFRSSLFIPIALIFAGRVMTRRGKRTAMDDVIQGLGSHGPRPRPGPASSAPPVRKTAPPPPAREIRLEPVETEDLAAAIGFDEEQRMVEPGAPSRRSPQKPMTSEERIAEARRRFNR